MSERDLASLLKDAVDAPPEALDTDRLIRQAGARRGRQAVLAGLVGLVAIAVLGVGVGQVIRPPGLDGSGTGGSSAAEASGPACPDVIEDPTRAVDYSDLVIMFGQQYSSADESGRPETGGQVGTVTCSIAEITENGRWHVGPLPWPDGTATYLPTGTALYTVPGVDPECQLAARVDGRVVVYTALDPSAQTATPAC